MRSHGDLDTRNGMNRAPRSSLDLTARSFENQLMGERERERERESKDYRERESEREC
jgi:hypothetical protein